MERKGFSIVELLVIMAVIAFVGAIWIPAWINAHTGSQISCQSNMKQIGLATLQYVQVRVST